MDAETKKQDYKPSWPLFLFFGIFSTLCFYYSIWWGGIMFGIGALLCFPNEKGHSWIMQQFSNIKSFLKSLLYLGLVLLIIGGIIWFIGKTFGAIGNIGKYEGQTAEEWYGNYADVEDRYQQFKNCVEDYDNLDIREKIDYGNVLDNCNTD
jgi:hypothetical protein